MNELTDEPFGSILTDPPLRSSLMTGSGQDMRVKPGRIAHVLESRMSEMGAEHTLVHVCCSARASDDIRPACMQRPDACRIQEYRDLESQGLVDCAEDKAL